MISAALSAGGAQSTRIGIASTVIGVDSPSAPNGGCRISYDRGAVTIGIEAPVWPSPAPRTATTTHRLLPGLTSAIMLVCGW